MSEISPASSFRQRVAGLSLIGFPVTALVSSLLDAEEGTDTPPAELYAIAADRADDIRLAALLFILSSVLIVPAVAGMVHLVRDRGATLAHIGGALGVIGAMGHMGYGTWHLMLSSIPSEGADVAAVVAVLDRMSSIWTVLLPMLIALPLGLILLTAALRRARIVPLWVPLAIVSTAVAQSVIDAVAPADSPISALTVWTMVSVTCGYVGVLVLKMSPARWQASTTVLSERAAHELVGNARG